MEKILRILNYFMSKTFLAKLRFMTLKTLFLLNNFSIFSHRTTYGTSCTKLPSLNYKIKNLMHFYLPTQLLVVTKKLLKILKKQIVMTKFWYFTMKSKVY